MKKYKGGNGNDGKRVIKGNEKEIETEERKKGRCKKEKLPENITQNKIASIQFPPKYRKKEKGDEGRKRGTFRPETACNISQSSIIPIMQLRWGL